jgi:hypothetical protein
MIEKKDIIHCEVWRKEICDYDYEPGQSKIDSGVVHCDLQHIPEFFNRINGTKNKYIVISSRSDYGVCYQKLNPPWNDLYKAIQLFITKEHGYKNLTMPARINRDKCHINDTYSIKCYSFTDSTFDVVPGNVKHWFLTNNMIFDDERIEGIPFGINSTDGTKEAVDTIFKFAKKTQDGKIKRDKWLYINFQFYTPERADLYIHYDQYSSQAIATCDRDIKYEDYLGSLLEHKFCLCPNGNGVDCYRTWECLYLGCTPILQIHSGTHYMINKRLPIIFSHSLFNISKLSLRPLLNHLETEQFSLEAAKLSFWKSKIEQKRELLCDT